MFWKKVLYCPPIQAGNTKTTAYNVQMRQCFSEEEEWINMIVQTYHRTKEIYTYISGDEQATRKVPKVK